MSEQLKPAVVMTDPPYSSGGFQESGKAQSSVGTRKITLKGGRLDGDNLTTRGYFGMLREVFKHLRAANDLFLFTDWRMWTTATDAVEYRGWRVRSMIVWDKMTPGMGNPFPGQHELIVFGRRQPRSRRGAGNVIRAKRTGNINHPTEKPVELLCEMLKITEPGLVVDPFAGSGSTLIAARMLGRAAVGFEIQEEYAERAALRLSQTELLPTVEQRGLSL